MQKTVGIIYAGATPAEYKTFHNLAIETKKKVQELGYEAVLVEVRDEGWLMEGVGRYAEEVCQQINMALPVLPKSLHTENLVRIFELQEVKWLGTNAISLGFILNKNTLYETLTKFGNKVPQALLLPKGDPQKDGQNLFLNFPQPCLLYANRAESNFVPILCNTASEIQEALADIYALNEDALATEHIKGDEYHVAVLQNFRDNKRYVLPPLNISGNNAKLSDKEKKQIEKISEEVFLNMRTSVYLQLRFVVHPKRGIYITNLNPAFNLEPGRYLTHSLEQVGSNIEEFVASALETAKE